MELVGGVFTQSLKPGAIENAQNLPVQSISSSAAYRINDFLRIRVYGEYSINGERNAAQGYMPPMYPQSSYGAVMEVRLNDHIELHGGVERSYNPMKRKWETYPVFQPVIYWKRKGK